MAKKSLQGLTILLILLALAIRLGAEFEWLFPKEKTGYTIEDIKKVFPNADSFELQSDKSITVRSSNVNILGKVLASNDFESSEYGYNDLVPLLIGIDTDNVVMGIALLDNSETGEFLSHVYDSELLSQWNGKIVDSLLISEKVDVVSGATYSSKAIINGVQSTLSAHLTIVQTKTISWMRVIQLALIIVLIATSLIMIFKKGLKKYYFHYLFLVLVVFGFWSRKMLSLDLFQTWLQNGLPWHTNIELILLLFASVIMTVIGKQKYYCNYLCPMGALQMLVSKISPFKKRKFPNKIFNINLRLVYLCFIWSSLIIGISLPISNMEPFLAFTYSVSSWIMIAAGVLIVVVSVFFNRPWCALCPTGCALDLVPTFKAKQKK